MNNRVRAVCAAVLLSATSVVGAVGLGGVDVAAANGCGAEGGLSASLVPNDVPGIFDFTAACNAHDNCYGSLGATQSGCDSQFRDDMLASCSGGVVCGLFAELYSAAVRYFGAPAYTEAQLQAQHDFAVSELVRAMEEEGMVSPDQANEILADHGLPTNPIDVPDDAVWYDDYDDYTGYDDYGYDDYGYDDYGDYGNTGWDGYDDFGYDDFGGVNDGFDSWGDFGDIGGGWGGDFGGGWGGGGGGGGGGDDDWLMALH